MIRIRKLALVFAAMVLGAGLLGSCESKNTTTTTTGSAGSTNGSGSMGGSISGSTSGATTSC